MIVKKEQVNETKKGNNCRQPNKSRYEGTLYQPLLAFVPVFLVFHSASLQNFLFIHKNNLLAKFSLQD